MQHYGVADGIHIQAEFKSHVVMPTRNATIKEFHTNTRYKIRIASQRHFMGDI